MTRQCDFHILKDNKLLYIPMKYCGFITCKYNIKGRCYYDEDKCIQEK